MTYRSASSLALLFGASLLFAPAHVARAQANLSGQGFGYSTGQFSARANGTGGAIAEIDPLSPVNPASLAQIGTRMIYFQIEPEFRTVKTAKGSETTQSSRYPNVFGAIPVGGAWVVSLGASTLLDRTSSTTFSTTQFLNAVDSVPMTTLYKIDGAIDDVRLGLGWGAASWLRLGVGAHAITGHNLVSITQSFADSVTFATFTQQRVLGFSGGAASAGVQIVVPNFNLSVSGRTGGDVSLHVEDTLLAHAKMPTHVGASFAFTGIPNSLIAVRTAHDDWSKLNSLGSSDLRGVDSWDTSVGADLGLTRTSVRQTFLRAGFRDRTLPFQAASHNVTEQSYTGGLGTTWANGRVLTDLAVIYANRTAGSLDATEHAWTVSIGLTLRP